MKKAIFKITNECNLSCKGCAAKTQYIDIKASVDRILKNGYDWVFITGGEPLLCDELFSVCKKLRDNGIKVGVSTNGTIRNDAIFDVVDRIGVSIDGGREYHDSYRGEGVFDKATEFMSACVSRGIETVLLFTAFKDNVNQIEQVISIARNLCVDYLQVTADVKDHSVMIPDIKIENPKLIIIDSYNDTCDWLFGKKAIVVRTNKNDLLTGVQDEGEAVIEDCYSQSNVSATEGAAGFIGFIQGGSLIEACSASGSVVSDSLASGFCLTNYGYIKKCCSISSVVGECAAGFVLGEFVLEDPYYRVEYLQ